MFEDNQVDLEALQSCLASVAEVDDAQEVSVYVRCFAFVQTDGNKLIFASGTTLLV